MRIQAGAVVIREPGPRAASGLAQRGAAEGLVTAFLTAAVVGSGIMAERLSGADAGQALLANALATGAALVALISMLAPVSGAHFNPVVTLVAAVSGDLRGRDAGVYIGAQIAGALSGVACANLMFGSLPVVWSQHARGGPPQLLGEVVATFGLVGTILGTARSRPASVPLAVACYIVAAYWFTVSTSFANPAVTLARCMTDTFTGIRPADVPAFIAAQLAGGALAAPLFAWMLPLADRRSEHWDLASEKE
jgi:glycerol uptake facilitator-like aquaporin